MRFLTILCVFALWLGTSTTAEARLHFGNKDDIRILQDIALVGPAGEDLILAHKVTTTYLALGVFVKDDGYVLRVKGTDKYFPLDTPEKIKELQDKGALPNPMPEYKLEDMDYIMGFSLYLALLVIVGWAFLKKKTRGKKEALPPAE